jgi:hypothetical protein
MNSNLTIRLLPLLLSLGLHAQSINSTVGGSQLSDAYGIKTDFKWREISGWTGVGYNEGFALGAYVQVPVTKQSHIGAGDQWLSSYVDTDEFDTHSFSVRGVGFGRTVGKADHEIMALQVVSGFITRQYWYPFLLANSTTSDSSMKQTALTAVVYRRRLSQTLQTHGVAIWDGKFTSIGSVGWKPSSRLEIAGAAGTGSNAPYYAIRGNLHLHSLNIGSSYTVAGKSFHRQEEPYYSTEPVGWNARFEWIPIHGLKVDLNRDHQRTWFTKLPEVESTSNSASIYGEIARFELGSTFSGVRSNTLTGLNRMQMFSVSRQILPRWRSFGAYIRMDSEQLKQESWLATNEIRVSPRLSVRQNFNRVNGTNSFTGGVTWISNRISFSVDNEVYISPLAASFGGKSLFQAWTFSIRLRTPHGTTVNENTFIDPTGKLQWGGYLSGLRYQRLSNAARPEEHAGFSKFVIRGRVVDEDGKGVWGIALQIGAEIVYSDSNGDFFIHVKDGKPLPFAVVSQSSLQSARWVLSSAPISVRGTTEDVPAITVVVQMGSTLLAHGRS